MKKALSLIFCIMLFYAISNVSAYDFNQSNSKMLKDMRKWTLNEWYENMKELSHLTDSAKVKKVLTTATKAVNSNTAGLEPSDITDKVATIVGDGTHKRIYVISASRGSYTISLNEEVFAMESMDISSTVPESTTPTDTVPDSTTPSNTVPDGTTPEGSVPTPDVPDPSIDVIIPTVSGESTSTGN